MVRFERALVSSYRPSALHSNVSSTFTLCRDIVAFVPQHATFPHPTSSLSKFTHVPLWSGGLGYEERRCWANCPCNSFQDFQPMWSWCTNVTVVLMHQRHRRTTCNLNTALCTIVHHAVKKSSQNQACHTCKFLWACRLVEFISCTFFFNFLST